MANTYCVATSTGKGFITHHDRSMFNISGYGANVWVVGNNNHGVSWINRVNGTAKVKADAQALVDAEVETLQAEWDALPAAEKAPTARYEDITRPVKYTLP